MVKLDKNIPIPPMRRGPAPLWPIRTMEIGESFVASVDEIHAVRAAVTRAKPKKFTTRKIDEGHIRCWRVE